MDLNLLRRMAGIDTPTPATVSIGNEQANNFRRLAGLTALPTAVEEKAEEDAPAEETAEEEKEEELPSIVTKIATKAEGMKGEELVELIKKVYDAGFADGQETPKEKEEVEEALAPMGISDELAAKKIFDKIKGTPNLKLSSVEQMVSRYLSMVGKTANDVKHLTALTASLLKDADLMD